MLATLPGLKGRQWSTIRFASTLYLYPILDLLLAEVPPDWKPELRLGLQEALVNAAKHGNQLDPGKTVSVRFSIIEDQHWWIIADQGDGFTPPSACSAKVAQQPCLTEERGRGLYILYQIFDQVHWYAGGTKLGLCKCVKSRPPTPMIH